jgi:ubiquinone/menaquinone biosynthesis C-methylase UbiE
VGDSARYIPALGYRWLTGFYDPVVALTTRETVFKRALLEQAGLRSGMRVLDLACGTATLTIAAHRACPGVELRGLDGDQDILRRARGKAEAAGAPIQFDHAFSTALPYAAGSFDRVLSSLFFHHIPLDAKRATFAEVRRVLKPGAELHVADWGRAHNVAMRAAFLGIQLLDGFTTTADNVRGRLPVLMGEAGFESVAETRRFATMFGTMSLYRAVNPR